MTAAALGRGARGGLLKLDREGLRDSEGPDSSGALGLADVSIAFVDGCALQCETGRPTIALRVVNAQGNSVTAPTFSTVGQPLKPSAFCGEAVDVDGGSFEVNFPGPTDGGAQGDAGGRRPIELRCLGVCRIGQFAVDGLASPRERSGLRARDRNRRVAGAEWLHLRRSLWQPDGNALAERHPRRRPRRRRIRGPGGFGVRTSDSPGALHAGPLRR